ncbi:tRNA guanosine(34) transglycosylase Tgt [Candidatus Saccharibacteria bacterium]|nr:tRNA guanosine(34) transglycosylase Tgt [Candidatus Saccharibacteria bacterium]
MDVKNTLTDIVYSQNGSRQAVLHTRRGDVVTPTFMPDGTRGVVKSLTAEQVASTGVQIVLANTYHLHLQPGEEVVSRLGGVHEFGKWQGPILTDSGGFQVFSLSKLRKITEEGVRFKHPVTGEMRMITPEKSIQIQLELGADMIVAFDHLTGLDEVERGKTLEAYERTHRWLERCVKEFNRLTLGMDENQKPILFGVVQGGLDKELRRGSLEVVQSSGVGGIAIGGLSVGETKQEMYDILEFLSHQYDDSNRPRFLLGVGDPPDIRYAIEHGIDMLDCVLPTRNARHATVWIEGDHKIHLTNSKFIDDTGVIDEGCDCYTCVSGYSRGFLRHQFKVKEPLAGSLASIHNLRYLTRICESYR